MHVQAPPVVPGIAVVNVKAADAEVLQVTAFINTFDAQGGTPPPDVLEPTGPDTAWRTTRLWVMAAGSNSVTIAVHGSRGDGSVVVPLVAVAGRRLAFDPWLAGLLVAVALFLLTGLFTIVGATVREGVLAPGVEPDADRKRRARWAIARAVVVVVLVIAGMASWMRAEDRQFARNLFRPLSVAARVDSSGGSRRFVFAITDSLWVHRNAGVTGGPRASRPASELIEDHGKLVHLFLISTDGRSAFAHLHPTTTDSVTFSAPLPPLPAGDYRMFADIVQASGFAQTLTASVTLSAPAAAANKSVPGDSADSWALGRMSGDSTRAQLEDGTALTWLRAPGPVVAGEEAGLRFTITPPVGESLGLEPYLGMAGHSAVVRDDGKVFIHLHPLGTISVAAQERLTSPPVHPMSPEMPMSALTDTLHFPYAFPDTGHYDVWVQIKRRGRILTAVFPVTVAPKGG